MNGYDTAAAMPDRIDLGMTAEETLKAAHELRQRMLGIRDRLIGSRPEAPRTGVSGPKAVFGGITGSVHAAREVLVECHGIIHEINSVLGDK